VSGQTREAAGSSMSNRRQNGMIPINIIALGG
jgi:hypothetical protein